MSAESLLLSPVHVGTLPLSNRVVMAPMTRSRGGLERMASPLIAEYYAQRAAAGLIISEGVSISDEANGWNNTPAIYSDAMAEAWEQVTDAVHGAGGRMFMQLWHCGRASHSDFHADGSPPVAPSAIKLNGEYIHTPKGKQSYQTPRALEVSEIPRVVADYCRAAERAKQAGFDGVELHAANGYLVDEFLQSRTNQRTDEYGGSIENRLRFLIEIVTALTTVWPASRVGVRLSPNGVYNDMGSPDYRETFLAAAQALDGFGLAYLHLLDGLAFGFHELGEPVTLAEFRRVFHGRLMGNCGYSQAAAEAAIARGDADLISFGRPFISNPDLVARFRNDWPLNPPAAMSDWYSFSPNGFADFPAYSS
jgi:N-ethylmaleimide reductase